MGNENYLPPPPGEKVSGRTWLAVLASLLGAFMAVLDIAITNSSLRDILGALSATQEEGSWISSAYLVAEIVVIPLAGFLAMVFSTRRYLVVNVVLFLIFSTLCGMAWSLESMIAFRAAQGFTGGVMIPMAMTLVTRKLPLKKRPIGLALFGMTATLAPTLGPTVGGYLTELYGWPSIFYINWVPGVLLVLGVSIGLDKEPMNLQLLRDVDWWGIGFMAVGLGSLTAMLEEGNAKDWFQSRFIITAAVLAVVGIYGWAWRGLTRKNTFIDLHIFGRPSFLIAAVIAFTTGMGLYGSAFILPLYLGQIAEEQKRNDDALQWYSHVESGEQYLPARIRAAQILARQGRLDDGRALIRDAEVEGEVQRVQLILAEAQLMRDFNQAPAAFELLEHALERQPDNPELLYDYGMLAERLDKLDILESSLRKLIGILNTMLARGEKWDPAKHAIA